MDSNYTVADLRTAMARYSYTGAEFLRKLNRVSERFLNSEVFTDLFTIVQATTTTGFLTIPREYGRAYGVQIGDVAAPVRSQHVQFTELGMIRGTPSCMSMVGLEDLGNHFVTQHDVWSGGIEQTGTLRVKISVPADASKVFRLFGTFTEADGVDRGIRDSTGAQGRNLTSVNPSADTTQQFKAVTGIQAPLGLVGRWTLWKVIAGVETLLGTYDPDELRPRYTRYQTRTTSETIRMFCRRKHVDYVADTDFVYPSNKDAFDHGFTALTMRDKVNYVAENEAWEQGKKVLKEEYAATVPAPVIRFSSDFGRRGGQGFGGAWG